MGHRSTGTFRTLHALRIKGFATVSTLADMTGSPSRDVEAHLAHWSAAELVQFRETRALWQLTATGRALHLDLLREDVAPVVPNSDLAAAYGQFLAYNEQFKELCGAWQIFKFNGELNDHSDAELRRGGASRISPISTPRPKLPIAAFGRRVRADGAVRPAPRIGTHQDSRRRIEYVHRCDVR